LVVFDVRKAFPGRIVRQLLVLAVRFRAVFDGDLAEPPLPWKYISLHCGAAPAAWRSVRLKSALFRLLLSETAAVRLKSALFRSPLAETPL